MKTEADAEEALVLYESIREYKLGLSKVLSAGAFTIRPVDTFVNVPILDGVAKKLAQRYFSTEIKRCEKLLKNLGFDPNAARTET